jgi:hypothetical protein
MNLHFSFASKFAYFASLIYEKNQAFSNLCQDNIHVFKRNLLQLILN